MPQIAAGMMREIDGETGIPAGSAIADGACVDEDNMIVRPVLCEASRRRQAGIAGTDNQPIRRNSTLQDRSRLSRRQMVEPAIGLIVGRQATNTPHGTDLQSATKA
jgi:hypothetical protein